MISALMVCWFLIDGVVITETNVIRKKGRTEGRADKKYRSCQILLGLSWKPRWIASSPPHIHQQRHEPVVIRPHFCCRPDRRRSGHHCEKGRGRCALGILARLGVISRHYVALPLPVAENTEWSALIQTSCKHCEVQTQQSVTTGVMQPS